MKPLKEYFFSLVASVKNLIQKKKNMMSITSQTKTALKRPTLRNNNEKITKIKVE